MFLDQIIVVVQRGLQQLEQGPAQAVQFCNRKEKIPLQLDIQMLKEPAGSPQPSQLLLEPFTIKGALASGL